jgi:hypothetical protein
MRVLTYIFIFLTFGTTAQELKLQFGFEDGMTNSPLDSVQLKVTTTSSQILINQWTLNNEIVQTATPNNKMIKVRAQKTGFFTLDTIVNLSLYQREMKKDKPVVIHLTLRYDGQISGGYDVRATYQPEIAFSSELISVSDFVVVDENTMVLLTYPKRLNAGSELIWYVNDSIVSRRKVPEIAIRLVTDYRNRIYLRCEYTDYMLKNEELLSLVKVPREELDNYVRPILDTLQNEQLYFTTYKSHYPAFDFFKVQMHDTSHAVLHHVEDTEMMEFYRAEYKWADVRTKLWAWDMEAETGIDREIWVGANVFTNSIYYEAPYSEFFLVGDEVFVFDFYRDHLYKYDANSGEQLDSSTIVFHKDARKTGWERRMVQDPITKKIYTMYDEAGYTNVYEINLSDGTRKDKFTLFYRYVENVQVYNEELFYIYRPFESLQKKYLYNEGYQLIIDN